MITLICPAKVNLTLWVGAVSPATRGLHPIASWMIATQFGDLLRLEPIQGSPSRFDLQFSPDAPVPMSVDWPLEKDLVFRAYQLLEQTAGRSLPVQVTLRKQIPAGAGLGGGSSDAAGLLVGMNRLYELNLPVEKLVELGAKLGSDVAFLIRALCGTPSALVTGLGEELEPHRLAQPFWLVLVFPPFGCPTGPVYQAFDRLHPQLQPIDSAQPKHRIQQLLASTPLNSRSLFNDLAEPACLVQPELAPLRDQVQRAACGEPVHVTGSGSTLFLLARDESHAKTLARKVALDTGLPAITTRTL